MDRLNFPSLSNIIEYNYVDGLSAMDHLQYILKKTFLLLCTFTKGQQAICYWLEEQQECWSEQAYKVSIFLFPHKHT